MGHLKLKENYLETLDFLAQKEEPLYSGSYKICVFDEEPAYWQARREEESCVVCETTRADWEKLDEEECGCDQDMTATKYSIYVVETSSNLRRAEYAVNFDGEVWNNDAENLMKLLDDLKDKIKEIGEMSCAQQ